MSGIPNVFSGYAVSQCIRKRIEEAFGWIKTSAGQDKTKFRGRDRVGWAPTFTAKNWPAARGWDVLGVA